MTQSEARCIVARGLNEILERFYQNISDNGVNLDFSFLDISTASLKDFSVYTAGFLGMKTKDEINEMLTEKEIDALIQGKFSLKRLSLKEAYDLAESVGKKLPKSGFSASAMLYKIQDGTYFVDKNISAPNSNGYINCISLKTSPVEYYSDYSNILPSPDEIFASLRNTFAHNTPYIDGNKIIFKIGKDEIVVSKMWLRGYSELFSRKSAVIEEKAVFAALKAALPKSDNQLATPDDVDRAIGLIKGLFPKSIQESFFRVNNFVKNRVLYNKNFYTLDIDSKIAIISAVCAYNPHYLSYSNETANSMLLYNLKQIVGRELENRDEFEMLDEDDDDLNNLVKNIEALNAIENAIEEFKSINGTSAQWAKRKLVELNNKKIALNKEQQTLLEKLIVKKKLESSNMQIYSPDSLKYLPVEVAANIVFLLGFNNLVTSAFYEDLLSSTDLNNLSKERSQFFSSINLEKFTKFYNDKKTPKNYTPEQTAFMLYVMRQALCHGNISYQLPPVKQGASASFKDVVLTFNGDWQNVKITGRLEDFYELFTSPVFTNKRPRVLLVRDEIRYNPQKDKKPEKSKQVSERESFSNNNADEPE